MSNVLKKLQEARVKLQGMPLKKSGHNKFVGYDYFELQDFIPTTQTIFNELGLCGVINYSADVASLTIYDADGSMVDPVSRIAFTSPMSSASLKGCHEVQNLGATQSYLRRYLWIIAMEIVEHDTLDATMTTEDKTLPKKVEVKAAPKVEVKTAPKADAAPFDAETFKAAMLDWGKAATSTSGLSSLWKENLAQLYLLEKRDAAGFEELKNAFREIKNNLKEVK